ncbi:MAG: hypothetical protein M0P31_01670 [Solirubrobacteraceae bacterium]|nr:hypothetical protein [Solirubrobacteraceae bacterium]
MLRRLTVVLATSATALTAVGCGGGDPGAFADATDATCRDVAAAVTSLRGELVGREGSSEQRAIADAVGAYANRIDAAATTFSGADPPGSGEEDFRDAAVDGLREHARRIRAAAESARDGRIGRDLAAQLQRTGPSAMPDIPGAVLDDAPACRAAVR